MYNYIYEYQFPPGLSDDPDMVFLMERYWKGLCRCYTVLYCTVLYCTVQVLVYVGVGAVLVGLAVTGVGAPPAANTGH